MFTTTDYDKLQQIMEESDEKRNLLTRLLESHRMTISTISHEIRNPLTLVYSTLQLIEAQHPEVLSYRHWSGMRSDVEYMTQLLDELSSYNNGELLHMTTIEANTFFKTLSLSFASSIVDTDITYTSRIEPDLPCIQADSVKLRQLLLNLLVNARDAVSGSALETSDNRQPVIRLEVSLLAGEDSAPALLVSVTDNGCGIEADAIDTIFEPFVTHKSGGTGLGLAIASRVAKAHHGSLTVSSTVGVGTTFRLALPI